jgi:mannose-1-phosphate guanylyltransferase
MQPQIARWLGEDRPKQFCAFVGKRTMLEHTIDRAVSFCSAERVVTVISRGQRRYMDEIIGSRRRGSTGILVEQPAARGTAAGVYGGLSYVVEREPDATVVVLPSDHFVYPEPEFLRFLDVAAEAADLWNDRVILLAARPTGPETDYGWIETGAPRCLSSRGGSSARFYEAAGFHEKPDALTAQLLWNRGGMWNTMVMVGKVRTLNVFGWRALPEMMGQFETLRQVLRAVWAERVSPDHEEYALTHVYGSLREADFCRDVLQYTVTHTLVLPMDGVHWSDWGRPERLLATMEHLGWSKSVRLPFLAACQ